MSNTPAVGQVWVSKGNEKAEVTSYNETTKRVSFVFRGSKYTYGLKLFLRHFPVQE